MTIRYFRQTIFIVVLLVCRSTMARGAEGFNFGNQNPAQPAAGCRVEAVDYQGWKAESLVNPWITMIIVPKLGGRLMQVTFDGHPYLFVNPQYKGQYFPPSVSAAQHRWFNYGGDKLWPLPEGDQDEHHWPGATGDVLDDGEFSLQVLSQGPGCAVRLEGPSDPRTGLQYTRDISIGADSPQIIFHAVMKNITGHPIEWSMQSVSQYDTADPNRPGTFNRDFRAYTPINPHSVYLNAYHVQSGLANSPSIEEMNNGLFTLHWSYLENEFWIDSPGDWLAVVDGSTGYAMVEQFHVVERANYPGNATVIFYVNGPSLRIDEAGMPGMTSSKPGEIPYYMEAELNSPLVRLSPGETYAMDTTWLPARMAGRLRSVCNAAVVSEPLVAGKTSAGIHLSGAFGVFYRGRLVAHLYHAGGMETGLVPLFNVDPTQPVELNQDIPAPPATARISVHLEDSQGLDRGSLGEARVN
jgi:hypothetical protein